MLPPSGGGFSGSSAASLSDMSSQALKGGSINFGTYNGSSVGTQFGGQVGGPSQTPDWLKGMAVGGAILLGVMLLKGKKR